MPHIKNWLDSRIELKEGVDPFDEKLASVSHALGFLAALVALILMIFQSRTSPRALGISILYGLTMCSVFGASALYHGASPSTLKRALRLVDHSSIYLLIAGTYTPYAAAMGERGTLMLAVVWILCLVGIITNILLWNRFQVLHIGIYLLMGWLVVFFWNDLSVAAPVGQIRWMFTGGIFYTLGVFFYMYRRIPRSHFIWHLFVIAGAAGLHVGVVAYALPRIIG